MRWVVRAKSLAEWAMVTLALVVAAGCDPVFEPIQTPDDRHFSIYGFLDASAAADTQWIRVAPIRTAVAAPVAPVDAVVMLEHLERGQVTLLRDSLFTYPRGIGAELVAYNFWTTQKIEPGATYRLNVTGPDGATASATVAIPGSFPSTIVVEVTGNPLPWAQAKPPDIVEVEGVGNLALVEVLHHIPEECRLEFSVYRVRQPLPHPSLSSLAGEGVHRIPVQPMLRQGEADPQAQNPVPCDRPVVRREVNLVASGSEWPSAFLDAGAAAYGGLTHNVENAFGFVGGVNTTSIPLESCRRAHLYESCRLVYGPESASLRGTLRDHDCDGRTLNDPGRQVVLTEIESGQSRTANIDRHGAYRIGAIPPGVVHELIAIPAHISIPYADTLTFQVGEEKAHDVSVRTFPRPCPEG